MDKRIRFYIDRKNPVTWLMVLCLLASAVVRIVYAGMRGTGDGNVWALVVLPVVACVLFGALCLFWGKELYYKTAIPVYLMALYFCFATAAAMPHVGGWIRYLLYFMYFTLATVYALAVDGRIAHFWIMLLMYIIPLGVRVADNWSSLTPAFVWESLMEQLPDTLFFLGLLLGIFATRIQNDGKYHPTWGDRSDGRRVRTLEPMAQVSPYIMVHRNESSNMFSDAIEITNAERYIRQKRREGMTSFGLNHLLLAAYARVVARYPEVNRFLAGQKVYSRGQDLQVCMTIKKEMTVESPESVIKIHLKPTDTARDVYEKFNREVEKVKNAPLNSDFDNTARILTLIPGVVLKFVVWLLKLLDYFGLLPGFLLEVSPFHGSMFATSMGSLGIPAIYHHLYDFGNLPVFIAFSRKRSAVELNEEGQMVHRKYMDVNFTLDERICDGFSYAAFYKYLKRLLAHPEVLDLPPETVKQDIP